MSNISSFAEWQKKLNGVSSRIEGGPIDNRRGPPDDGGMEARVAKLEEFAADARDRLVRIESRLDHTPTKADLHKEISSQTWKVISFVTGAGSLLVAATYFVATSAK